MYRVGDYVYFENSASSPFAIRRIDELNRWVTASKMCIDSPEQLLMIAYIFGRIYTDEIGAFKKCVQIQKGWQTERQFFHSFAYELYLKW